MLLRYTTKPLNQYYWTMFWFARTIGGNVWFNGLVAKGKSIGLMVYWFSGIGQKHWFNGLVV